ncbi:MAG: hypothetical protein WB783_20740 [Arenicellales bacterium]
MTDGPSKVWHRRLRKEAVLPVLLAALLGFSLHVFKAGEGIIEAAAAPPPADSAAAQQHVSCASCHREHQGRDHTLTSLSGARCEACHTDVTGFPEGHPEFKSYPYKRRTRIVYDHVGHARKYFPKADPKDVPKACTSCHAPDSRGEQMLVKGFETSCSACHSAAIRGEGIAGSAGIPVITIPGLDLDTLRQAGAGIGGWPELSDRKLTPFMRALFAGDPKLSAALERFDKLDPMNLSDAKPADIQAVETIAWATKDLFYDLLAKGPTALQPELSAALGSKVSETAAREMLGGMTLATVRAAQTEWFPHLFKDVSLHRAGKPVPMPPSQLGKAAAAATTNTGGGSQENSQSGSGSGSHEDILGGQSGSGSGSQEDILGGQSGGGSGGQEDILGGQSGSGSDDQGDILGGQSGSGGGQEDILGSGSAGNSGGGDILSGSEGSQSGGGDILSGGGGGASGGEAAGTPAAEAQPPKPNPESWTRFGGWYHDYFALVYRPSGHADRFLERWLEVTATAMGGSAKPVAAPIFTELSAKDAPGQCMKCHSSDSKPGGGLALNWRGKQNDPHAQHFTRFVHAPHLTLLTESKGCTDCHSYDETAKYLAGFDNHDPKTYASNFQPITQAACDQCHVERSAGNACVQCHLYHGGHTFSRDQGETVSMSQAPGASRKQ